MRTDAPTTADLTQIPDPVVRQLAALGRMQRFPRNAVIIAEGDSSDTLYVVFSGRVKVFVSDKDGGEMVLGTCGTGEYIGELALDGQPRSASVVTLEASVCSIISRAVLRDAIAGNTEFAMQLIATLIARTRIATDNIKHLALNDVYGRVAHLLLNLADKRDGDLVVRERLSQQEIADRVGASRDMVSRILKDLVTGGYISMEHKVITIKKTPPSRW
jgi:CRP/FNR family cyclic AMP-dependent transcriptional regulator